MGTTKKNTLFKLLLKNHIVLALILTNHKLKHNIDKNIANNRNKTKTPSNLNNSLKEKILIKKDTLKGTLRNTKTVSQLTKLKSFTTKLGINITIRHK